MIPPKSEASDAVPPPTPAADRNARAGGRREKRAVLVGLGVSGVLHLAFLLLYPFLMGRLVPVPPPGAPAPPDEPRQGMEVVLLIEVPEPELPDGPAPDPTETEVADPIPEVADPGAPGDDEPDPDLVPEVEPGLSVAERLRPRMTDPRLWAPLDPELTDLSDEERAELLLRGMIQSWNDSVAVAAALSGQALDWTYTDDEGRRWGLSPGRLHLGDFSIPIPLSFTIPPPPQDDMARRQWIIEDIMRGAASAQIRETWAERAQEIRRRMEAERERR